MNQEQPSTSWINLFFKDCMLDEDTGEQTGRYYINESLSNDKFINICESTY